MTTEEMFASIVQQNEVIISLLARLAWPPEKIGEIVMFKKKDPEAYVRTHSMASRLLPNWPQSQG